MDRFPSTRSLPFLAKALAHGALYFLERFGPPVVPAAPVHYVIFFLCEFLFHGWSGKPVIEFDYHHVDDEKERCSFEYF